MEEDEKRWKSVIVSACVRGCECVCVCEVERGGRGWLPAGWIARNRARDDSEGKRVACRGRVGLLALEMKAGSHGLASHKVEYDFKFVLIQGRRGYDRRDKTERGLL